MLFNANSREQDRLLAAELKHTRSLNEGIRGIGLVAYVPLVDGDVQRVVPGNTQ